MKSYYFNKSNETAKSGVATALFEVFKGKTPIICCVGTDAVAGDSLGPLVGTILKGKLLGKTYIYGTLDKPITAREISSAVRFIKRVHQGSKVLAVDAALGGNDETGLIKVVDRPIKPGLGVEKDLSEVGDASIIGIVEEKQRKNLLSSVRISTVYSLASVIAGGISEYFEYSAAFAAKEKENKFILL